MAKKKAKKKVAKSKAANIASKIAKTNKELQKAREKALNSHSRLFYEAVAQLFEDHEELQSFRWDQYTPHWNDGDECEFSCYFDSLMINDETGDDYNNLYDLERLDGLLSDKESEVKRIRKSLETTSDKWEIDRLQRDLDDMEKYDPEVISNKYVIKKAIYDLLNSIDEEFYQENFGEGTVVVTREGVTTEHCEHD